MPPRPPLPLFAVTAILLTLGACDDRSVPHDLPTQEKPVADRPLMTPASDLISLTVDAAYERRGVSDEALFVYDEPVALPAQHGIDDDEPKVKVPAAFRRKTAVVLDLCGTAKGGFTGLTDPPSSRLPGLEPDLSGRPSPLGAVTTVYVYNGEKRRLAAFAVTTEACRTITGRTTFAHDRGSYVETIEHLRMACPAAVDEHLRAVPSEQLTIIGVDAAGRTVLVQEADGYVAMGTGIDRGVRIGKRVVSLSRDAAYAPVGTNPYYLWRSLTRLVADEAVGLNPSFEPIDPKRATKAKKIPEKFATVAPLVLEIDYGSPAYDDAPLAKAKTIYVFGDRDQVLATLDPADGWYTRTNWNPEGAGGLYHHEVLRLAFDPAVIAPLRGVEFASVSIVVVGRDGKTILNDSVHPCW